MAGKESIAGPQFDDIDDSDEGIDFGHEDDEGEGLEVDTEEPKKKRQADDDDQIEIEFVDNTPPEDRGKPKASELDEDFAPPSDDELKTYSDGVQKRIKDLTFRYNSERREKDAALRQAEEALNYAKQVHSQHRKLQEEYNKGRGAFAEQANARIEAQLASLQTEYNQAYEEGDAKKLFEVSQKLSALNVEKAQVEYAMKSQPQQQERDEPPLHHEAPRRASRDDNLRQWLDKNPWFNSDQEMTDFAMRVHEHLVSQGFNAAEQPEAYYSEIDKRMRQVYPNYFSGGKKKTDATRKSDRASAVAGPSRETANGAAKPRKVRLSPEQVALAERLGLTPQQYAKELIELGDQ